MEYGVCEKAEFLKKYDPEVAAALSSEIDRQRNCIELIASENFISIPVMETMGTVFSNKYAEGFPGKRYYGGCVNVDTVERLAIERVKKLFSAEHANVQPHSGAQSNQAVYFALAELGDVIMGMDLSQGGHLTHGSPVNYSGKNYHFVPYGVDPHTHAIDYAEVRRLALENKPKIIVAGASAYPGAIDFKKFADIAAECGAYLMVDMSHIAGLVAAGLHQNPVPYADVVTTTTHKTLRGPRGGVILCRAELAQKIDKAVFPGNQGGPLEHIIAAKAVCFKEALSDEFKQYQQRVVRNARVMADELMHIGFDLVYNGTDNHLMLLDLRNFGITGKEAERRLDSVGITVNKNTVPNETQSPFITSGIRIGTPAITTRGFDEDDCIEVAALIKLAVTEFDEQADYIRARVAALCKKHPLY